MKYFVDKKNICVIGGAGFIGSHLVDYLLKEKSCQVLVLDNLHSGSLDFLNPQAKFINFDVRSDAEEYIKLFKENNIDYIFNYSAEPYVPGSYERPLDYFEVNALAVIKILEAANACNIKRVLQVSSAEIYGESKGKITELCPVTPRSSYGVSKVAADGICQVRSKETSVEPIILRQFNCLGERETHRYVIPEIISQLSKSSDINLGNNSTRDFLYVKDAVAMAVELLEKGQAGEAYNMGSETSISIYNLAKLIGELMGHKEINITRDETRSRIWEIWNLMSDNSKLYQTINYRPQHSLKDGLQRTLNYFYENNNKWIFEQ